MKGAIRKNLLTERIDIVKPLGWYRDSPTLTDVDVKYLLLYFEENYGLTVEKKIIDAVAVIANENRYHPVCDFLNALHWDGTERIRFCLHRFLGSDTDDYTYEALKLFLLGAISRAFKPGCKFEVMLCLVGGQGAGKSSFFRLLAVNDDWFSDDLKKLEDENVYRKMQGHWIIEMSEMIATANAKSIEEIKSFLSRQKETYKIPYETHPADRKRQCVFGGSSNTLDFLPLDRTGNRRFVPVMVYPERAEVHILADEQASREYINQMWAEAMEIYRSGNFRLRFSPAMNAYLKAHQKDFMPEDTKAGQILDYLERYSGSMVCSKQLYKEALGHDYDEPKQWELREINDIMNNAVTGWRAFSNPRYFPEPYRRQKGWERIRNDNEPDNSMDGWFSGNPDRGNGTVRASGRMVEAKIKARCRFGCRAGCRSGCRAKIPKALILRHFSLSDNHDNQYYKEKGNSKKIVSPDKEKRFSDVRCRNFVVRPFLVGLFSFKEEYRMTNIVNSTLPTPNNHSEKNKPDGVFVIKQGKTNYKVKVFFDHSSGLTAEDRLKRIIQAEAERESA